MTSEDRSFIRSFIKVLNAAGGLMDERTFLELFQETKTEMNLEQDGVAELHSMCADMEKMGIIKKAPETKTELWLLTLEGLRFAGITP